MKARKMKAIFGASGMLGKYVTTYFFEREQQIFAFERADLDVANASLESLKTFLEPICKQVDVVINCAGMIKPRVTELGVEQAIRVNSLFPHLLSRACGDLGVELIHISTDCVYSGDKRFERGLVAQRVNPSREDRLSRTVRLRDRGYNEYSTHDAVDDYGKTKSLGEPGDCTVIRTSIVGEEVVNRRSLIEWLKGEAGGSAEGYTNHLWNGVTCLQLAKSIEKLIKEKLFWKGVRHIYSKPVSKYELLCVLNEVYELSIDVLPFDEKAPCDRTLSSIYSTCEVLGIPPIREQVVEMKNFGTKGLCGNTIVR